MKIHYCKNCNKDVEIEKKTSSTFHEGWGAGDGTVDREELICKECKRIVYTREKDNIPGFRSEDIWEDKK